MKIWKPWDTFGKKNQRGSTIQYHPNFGYFNGNENIEIAHNSNLETELEKNLPHYHEYMNETYLIVKGAGTMLIDEKDEIEMKPSIALTIEPNEVHRILQTIDPVKYGPLEYFIIKNPSIPNDKKIVKASYK